MIRRVDLASCMATSWKNGGGTTRELAAWPERADLGDFDWRISVADIEADGAFSIFPGVDRHIVLLDGAGVELTGPHLTHRLEKRYQPFEFDGGIAISARLLGGASRDFNVMHRREGFDCAVDVLTQPTVGIACEHGLIYTLDGKWRANGETLSVNQGICWADELHAWQLEPSQPASILVAVRLARRG